MEGKLQRLGRDRNDTPVWAGDEMFETGRDHDYYTVPNRLYDIAEDVLYKCGPNHPKAVEE